MAEMGFYQELMDQVKNLFTEEERAGLTFSLQTVHKQNNRQLQGITIKSVDSDAAPCFYVNESRQRYEQGESMDVLAAEIKRAYIDSLSLTAPAKMMEMDLKDYDMVKDHITMRLLDIGRNENFLQDKPYLDVGNGLALVCDIRLQQAEEGFYAAVINDDLLKEYGCSSDTLFQQAMNNAWEINTPKLYRMQMGILGNEMKDLLNEQEPVLQEEKEPMYILSNDVMYMGAASLYAPMVQRRISEVLNEGYYVLPSSIHEVLIVPESAGMHVQDLCRMVRGANQSVVADQDMLSDYVYHYDQKTAVLQTVVSTDQPFLLSLAELSDASLWLENRLDYEQTLKEAVLWKLDHAMLGMHRDGKTQVPFGKIASAAMSEASGDPKLEESLDFCLKCSPTLQGMIDAGQLMTVNREGVEELQKIFKEEIGMPKEQEKAHAKTILRDRGEEIA